MSCRADIKAQPATVTDRRPHAKSWQQENAMGQGARLRELIKSGQTLVMPDAYDAVSAKIIERLGFQAVQCSGFSIALGACCRPEVGLGMEENLHVTRHIVEAVSVPVMADAEDGFGDASAAGQTARRYSEVGAAGMNIEDQVLGLPGGSKRVVDRQLMLEKIAAARRAAADAGHGDFFINGRTDALAVASDRAAGMREAIERANRYFDAGADLAFVVGVTSLDEARSLVKEIAGPVSIAAGMPNNMGLTIAQLKECGVARVSLPTLAVFASLRAMTQVLSDVLAGQSFVEIAEKGVLCSMKDVGELLQP
jgi:2-methylisocitrate lyase-like PEP mutase family enzyme